MVSLVYWELRSHLASIIWCAAETGIVWNLLAIESQQCATNFKSQRNGGLFHNSLLHRPAGLVEISE